MREGSPAQANVTCAIVHFSIESRPEACSNQSFLHGCCTCAVLSARVRKSNPSDKPFVFRPDMGGLFALKTRCQPCVGVFVCVCLAEMISRDSGPCPFGALFGGIRATMEPIATLIAQHSCHLKML